MKASQVIAFVIMSAVAYKFVSNSKADEPREDILKINKSKRNVGLLKGHRETLPSEALNPELHLVGLCNNIVIKEWNTNFASDRTEAAKTLIQKTCEMAKLKYLPFLASRNIKVYNYDESYIINVSILPWDSGGRGGDYYRALNDFKWRFYDRDKFCDDHGRICNKSEQPLDLLGLSDRDRNWIYIENDIFPDEQSIVYTPKWSTIWAHELFHTWNWHTEVYHHFPGNVRQKVSREEDLARDFTEYCGYGR